MKALKLNLARELELVEEPDPCAGPDEVVVQVSFAGICGSDIHGVLPGGYRKPPLIMGHEIAGTTSDGRRVTVRATLGCGACDLCAAGLEQVCRSRSIVGIDRPGGFAERVAVPKRSIVELPERTPLEAGALVEPLAVALRAWKRSTARGTDKVGIIGAGNVGLLLLTVARHHGADVEVADVQEERRAEASRLGALAADGELRSEYDVIFEAVGASATHAASLERLRPGGVAVWLGTRSADPAFDALELVRREQSVISSFAYTEGDFLEAAELSASLRLDWTETYDLDQGADIFAGLVDGRLDATKVLLRA